VDLDLEKFFDTVNHDVLMHRVRQRVQDDRVTTLIRRFLKSAVSVAKTRESTTCGTPQGGPLSPLLANLLLDELDKELERRRHRFVRYADDCNIYVGSRHAGERVMASLKGFLEKRMKLTVNEQKSAVDRPWNRRILGFTFTRGKQYRRTVSAMALAALKAKIRRFTQRTRGYSLEQIIRELRPALLGWPKFAPATSAFPPSMAVRKRTSATPKSSRRSWTWTSGSAANCVAINGSSGDAQGIGACGRWVYRASWRGIPPNQRMARGD
jgi:RNA-directed DNA polymerase